MKIGKTARIALDVALTAMIVFEMFIQYTGTFLHEVVGFAFFATVVVHLVFSAAWMKSTARMAKKGTMSGRRIALAVMGCLLALCMVVLGVSSVAISNLLYSAGIVVPIGSYALWVFIHTVSSYALCALVVVHLGMHWAFLASAFKVPYNPERRRAIGTGVHAVAAVGAVALGVTAARQALPQALALAPNAEETASPSANANAESSEKPIPDQPSSTDAQAQDNSSQKHSKHANSSHPKNGASGERSNGGTSSGTEQAPQANSGSAESGNSGESQDSGSGGSATTASGICTLCRKQCPLSAPRCNKPYEAGLL